MDAQWRIESVERALESLEEFFPHAKDQAFLRKRQELRATEDRIDREAIEAELDLMDLEWSGRFPAYFYGSLLVLLWSEIEAVIERFAKEVQENKGVSLTFGDIGGTSTYSRVRKYIEAVLGNKLQENSFVEDLQFLRNIYAHHGGDISGLSSNRKKRIKAIARSNAGVTEEDTYVLVSADYFEDRGGPGILDSAISVLCPCG